MIYFTSDEAAAILQQITKAAVQTFAHISYQKPFHSLFMIWNLFFIQEQPKLSGSVALLASVTNCLYRPLARWTSGKTQPAWQRDHPLLVWLITHWSAHKFSVQKWLQRLLHNFSDVPPKIAMKPWCGIKCCQLRWMGFMYLSNITSAKSITATTQ